MSRPQPHFADLSSVVDINEPFNRGNQIHTFKGHPRQRRWPIPAWMFDTKKVWDFLHQVFPNMETDQTQARRAARWGLVVLYYFCWGFSARQVEAKADLAPGGADRIIQRIKLVVDGRRQGDGKPPTGRPKGRPRKALPKTGTVQNPVEK